MSFLISIALNCALNCLGRFQWYLDVLKCILYNILECIETIVIVIITTIIAALCIVLFISALTIIIGVTLLPRYLAVHYVYSNYHWLFILSIPIGLMLLKYLMDFVINRNG